MEIYGAKCDICEFNFEETYGEVGKGLIHVHHLNQLSKNTEKHIVNARVDLRPVCPNCHLILQRRKEPFSIEEVIDMIKNNKNIPKNVPKIKE
ncbi:HNH endonuclease [Clostridium sp. CF012]|nr:HNH endonuclease [Clostridium sp. CF012]